VILGPEDEAAFQAFCDASPGETIGVRLAWSEGNARVAAAWRDDRIVALAAHDRKGLVNVHAPEQLAELARECLQELPVVGICGRPEQVEAARAALGMEERAVAKLSREIQMALDVDDLVVPEILSRPDVEVRRARAADLAVLLDWRARFFREAHGLELHEEAVHELLEGVKLGRVWVMLDGGVMVNTVAFGAVFPGLVEIEYSYGPPETRVKTYGRSIVAGALLQTRAEGIRRAVFNTHEKNVAVRVATEPIGFRVTGRYWTMIFA
jgi:hypothetical protein